ncbi:MAG TPA: ParB/RepB/Spo0J family partition protein [Steroidobacteraceae bacterium]|nr:ParB/RepB/Spo0J family partition protein [Steroidobacteraceae bacterium]
MNEPPARDSGSFVTVDPFRCRVWKLNNRIEQYVNEVSCLAEIDSMARDGQLVPVIGRKLEGNPDFDIEVICGTRRLFVARHLKIPLRVELRDLTDRQAAAAIETENVLRKQTSPYERGLWLAKLLRENLYRSQDEMARALRITATQVTRLLKFAELPTIVIGAFSSPHEILESWAVELHKAWGDDRRRLLTDRARALEKLLPRPPAVSVYEMLMASRGPSLRRSRRGANHLVKSPSGEPLLRIERQRKEVVLRIPNALVDARIEQAITQAIVAALTRSGPAQCTATAA